MAKKVTQKVDKSLSDNSYLKYILYFLLALFIYVFIMNAWVGDDAYITFRTVDNFVNGYGLTWNTSERVQAYTHPLWMFIHSIFYFLTGNIYYTTMFLSFAFSFAAIWLLVYKLSANKLLAIAGLITLIISKVFIDYTSSGLENPLTYFLIILFLIFYFNQDDIQKKLFKLSLITALVMLNRMDLVLLCLPALIYIVLKNWKVKHLLYIFYGFVPFILWEIFSIIYYGFPFPNTYYAKLNTGIPIGEYIKQGLSYYSNLFNNDTISGIVIFSGIIGIIVYSFKNKNTNIYLPLVIGIVLYLLYILRIGGDFMSGRFFAVPFLMVVAILTNFNIKNNKKNFIFAITILLILLSGLSSYHPVLTGPNHGLVNGKPAYYDLKNNIFADSNFINDERGNFYPEAGLIPLIKAGTSTPKLPITEQGSLTGNSSYKTIVQSMIGMFGFYAGPDVYIIDFLGLPEPFLSRLKASKNPDWKGKWRIGHFYRRIPVGYIETIKSGKNLIENKKLKEFYKKIKFITEGEIFNTERFAEIFRINTGYYDDLKVDDYRENDEPKLFSGDYHSYRVYLHRLAHYYKLKNDLRKSLDCQLKLFADTKRLIKSDNCFYTIYSISHIYFRMNKLDSAEIYSKFGLHYVKNHEEQYKYFLLLSEIYEKGKRYQKSIEVLIEYLNVIPNNVAILNQLAHTKELMNEYDQALEIYKKIIAINPNHEQIYQIYDKIYKNYFNRKNFDSAAYYSFKTVEKGGKVDSKILEILKKYKH